MNGQRQIFAVVVVALLLAAAWYWWNSSRVPFVTQREGMKALRDLDSMLSSGQEVPEISDDELAKAVSSQRVMIARVPSSDDGEDSDREGYRYYHWPYYYYSPYRYGGYQYPGLYSRMYHWSPGYYTGTGWMHYIRPGFSYGYHPRHSWVRHNGRYYYLTN